MEFTKVKAIEMLEVLKKCYGQEEEVYVGQENGTVVIMDQEAMNKKMN